MPSRPPKRKKSSSTKRNNHKSTATVHNLYSCKKCRRSRKKCRYSDPSDPCQRCINKGLGSDCGQKLNTKNQLKPDNVPTVTPTPTPTLTSTSASTVTQPSVDGSDPQYSAINRFRLSIGPEYSNAEILTCFIVFHILLVSERSFLQLLKNVPLFNERRMRAEDHITTIIFWLEKTFQTLMDEISVPESRLLDPLPRIQTILTHDSEPTSASTTQSRARTTSTVMLTLWNRFENTYPGARDILACVGNTLSDLYPGAFDYGLSTKEWDDSKREQLYGRVSEALNSIHKIYLTDYPRSPTETPKVPVDIFPYWQMAYRNKDKELALQAWKKLEVYPDVDVDFLGLCLAHWAIQDKDLGTLKEITARNMFIGHGMKDSCLDISPCQLAVIINSPASYWSLTNWTRSRLRIHEANAECLGFAARIGSWKMVKLLGHPNFTSPSYSGIIRMALDAHQLDIASELLSQMRSTWIPGEHQALANYADKNGFGEFAQKSRNMLRYETTASQALAAVGDQRSPSQDYVDAHVFQGDGIDDA